jgi:Flp pilus assembly protein TadG
MRLPNSRGSKRHGVTIVETAFVMLPTLILLFGIFEYARFLMVLNVFNNAAREGVRYALVNNTATTISADVTKLVKAKIGNQTGALTGLTVSVSGTHNGVSTPVNDLVAGDRITVTVTASYKFLNIIPVVPMPTTVSLSSAPTMVCEGAT